MGAMNLTGRIGGGSVKYPSDGSHYPQTRLPRMTAPFPGHERAKQMGELKRGAQRWEVFVETQPDVELQAVRGRLHFLHGDRHRATSWIFLESTERDIHERFGEFSAVELWHFLEALDD
jgi:hypothetical protein